MQYINDQLTEKTAILSIEQAFALIDRLPSNTKVLYLSDRKLISIPNEESIQIYEHPSSGNLKPIGKIERAQLAQLFDSFSRSNPTFTVGKIEQLTDAFLY